MRPSEIKVGKTYRNRGAGRTSRFVVEIVPYIELAHRGFCIPWYSDESTRPDEPIVAFRQAERVGIQFLYISSFAAWAGSEVSDA